MTTSDGGWKYDAIMTECDQQRARADRAEAALAEVATEANNIIDEVARINEAISPMSLIRRLRYLVSLAAVGSGGTEPATDEGKQR